LKESSENAENFSISPNYKVNNWKEAEKNADWAMMIKIFKNRLEGRFLEPIRLIAADQKIGKFSGFSILALDCLIIETLVQFDAGKDDTKGEGETSFVSFLTTKDNFKDFFNKEKAKIFYYHFRNGLLHQAQTKKKSLIKIGQESMVSKVSTNLHEGLIVDREKFHEAIEKEIKRYMDLLTNGDTDLRNNFVKKMNFICNLPE